MQSSNNQNTSEKTTVSETSISSVACPSSRTPATVLAKLHCMALISTMRWKVGVGKMEAGMGTGGVKV